MLPPDYKSIVQSAHRGPLKYETLEDLYNQLTNHVLLGDGTQGYWLDRGTGEVFRSYSARTLQFDSGHSDGSWSWVRKEGSRFPEVAYLDHSSWLEVNGEIVTNLPSGTYTLTWVLQFDPEKTAGFCDEPGFQPACFYFADGLRDIRTDCIYFPLEPDMVNRVRNGWLEYDHHTFTVEEDENMREVNLKFSLTETSSQLVKSGLYLDGIVIRPVTSTLEGVLALEKKETAETKAEEEEGTEEYYEKLLPPDYATIARIAKGGTLPCETFKELYDLLCEGVLLGTGSRGYWIDRRTNGVCRSYSARMLEITWGDNEEYWAWIKKDGSRFAEVAYLRDVCWLEVKGEVRTKLPSGNYTLSWVLQFDDGLERGTKWVDNPVGIFATDGTISKSESMYFPLNQETASRVVSDGWVEYDALQFRVNEEVGDSVEDMQDVVLKFSLTETVSDMWKSGLYIDGIVIRPSSMFSKAGIL